MLTYMYVPYILMYLYTYVFVNFFLLVVFVY